MTTEQDLSKSNRLRNHDPQDFISAWNNAESEEERSAVRQRLKLIDSGRWYDVLDDAHKHFAHADLGARRHLEGMYGQTFRSWIGVFGLVEDLNTFEEYTGVHR